MNIRKTLHKDTPKPKTGLWPFTSMRLAFGRSSKSTPQNTQQFTPSNLYHRCNETPLSVFITCACEHDLTALIKHGTARPEELTRAWEMIYSEYSDTLGNPTSKMLIQLSKDISFHDAKLRAVSLCLKVLAHSPDQRCIGVLRGYGYNYAFDISDPSQYAKDLEMVANRLASVSFALQQKRGEYQRSTEKVISKPMTRQGFDQTIAVLSKHMGYRVDPKETTVSEFVEYRKLYENEMEAIARANASEKRPSTVKSNL